MPDQSMNTESVRAALLRSAWLRGLVGAVLALLALFLLVELIAGVKEMRYIGAGLAAANTISVSGEGEVFAVPDIATFTFSAVGRAPTAEAAQTAATEQGNAALAYLKEQGIEEKDIKTIHYAIDPQYESIRCITYPCSDSQRISGYQTTQTMQVKVRDTDKTGALLSGITETGVSNISGIELTLDDEDAVHAQAREQAIADAREKADELAKALGVHIVRVAGFSENGGSDGPLYYAKDMAVAQSAAGSANPDIPMGENRFVSNVMVMYEIR